MSTNKPTAPPTQKSNVVNLGLYRIKKSLRQEGFEVVENPDGKITLVVRMVK